MGLSYENFNGKSPGTWPFVQQFVKGNNNENITYFVLVFLLEGNLSVTGEFPSQRASNVESVSMSWSHHDLEIVYVMFLLSLIPELISPGQNGNHFNFRSIFLHENVWIFNKYITEVCSKESN